MAIYRRHLADHHRHRPASTKTCNWLHTVDQAIATRRANARERALNTNPEPEPTNTNTNHDTEPDYEEEPPY